jgi:hypothetical protein
VSKMIDTLTPFKDPKYIPVEKALKELEAYKPQHRGHVAPDLSVWNGALLLWNIRCVDADDKVFEEYSDIAVDEIDMVATAQSTGPAKYTTKEAIEHFSLFDAAEGILPSAALTCNILAKLYQHRDNPDAKELLMQFKEIEGGPARYVQNTIYHPRQGALMHYPTHWQGEKLKNNRPVTILDFEYPDTEKFTLEEALKDPAQRRCVRNLTGLEHPEELCEINKYLGFPGDVQFFVECRNRASHEGISFGAGSYSSLYFSSTDDNVSTKGMVRAVRIPTEEQK